MKQEYREKIKNRKLDKKKGKGKKSKFSSLKKITKERGL